MSDIAIKVDNLSKKYVISHQQQRGYTALRDVVTQGAQNIGKKILSPFSNSQPLTTEEFYALKDVSFEIKQGDKVGIIGRNGAGKSTLLKILSRITEPSIGRLEISGRVASLLEVGTGFHPELTGRENIYLNGAILGMSRKEIKRKFDEIVAFSEVERFLDTPVKRFSSGMYVRLAFAVAAHIEPEILIIDEVLAVGDAAFQKKCLGKMSEIAQEGRTVLFVSHNMAAVNNLCEKGILLQNGTIQTIGSMDEVISCYSSVASNTNCEVIFNESTKRNGNGDVRFEWLKISDESNGLRNEFSIGDTVRFQFAITNKSNVKKSELGIQIKSADGMPIFHIMSRDSNFKVEHKTTREIYTVSIEDIRLFPGIYSVNIEITNTTGHEVFDGITECVTFRIIDGGKYTTRNLPRSVGLFFVTPQWTVLPVH